MKTFLKTLLKIIKNIFKGIFYIVVFIGLFALALKVQTGRFKSTSSHYTVTANTKVDPNSELAKYVTQKEINAVGYRYWDIDEEEVRDNPTMELLRRSLKSKDTDKILKFMQDNNISVDTPLHFGVTPLMYASFYDDEKTAKKLIEMGADLHKKDNYELSPMAYAMENNATKSVKLLLDSGVKFDEVEIVQETYGIMDVENWIDSVSFDENATPIVIDLNGDGVKTISRKNGKTYFDLDNNKFAENTSWIDKNDGILINKTLITNSITNGSELFGNHTLLRDGSLANNGFEALKEFANLNLLVA